MIASIIILIVLFLGTGGLIAFNIIKKRFIDIKNLVYFIPALLVLFAVYIVGYLHSSEPWDNSSIFACLTAAMDGFKFSIKKALVTEYMDANFIFKIDVYWATVLTGLTVFSSIAGIFKVTVMNFFARKSVTRKENFDIVIGNEEECKEFAKNHKKKCLYWVDPDFKKLTDEDKKGLYLNSIPFYNKPFIAKTLSKFVKKETHIICFQKSGEHLQRIIKIIKELPETDRVFYFHVQGEEDHLSFIDDELASITDKRKDLIALSFDLYELMAKAFNKQYNLAMYLPEEAFDPNCKYCIKKDYPINVVMLGFGKTAYAIFRGLIANNQFVHIDSLKQRFDTHKVKYYLYDKNKKAFDRSAIQYLNNFSQIKNKYLLDKNSLEPFELPCDIIPKEINYKSNLTDEFLNNFNRDNEGFTFYFICSSSSLDNAAAAKQIANAMAKTQIKPKEGDKDRAVIFYNDDDREDDFFVDSDQFVIPFGFKSKMFTHDFICDEEAWKQAKDVHELYLSRRQKDKVEEFGNLYLQEKQSNIYRSINTIFKLSTLGFRVDENPFNDARDLKADAIFKDIDDGKYASYSYEDYFKLTPRVAIAFQEHARWNMSYFLAGYQAMPLEQIDYKEGKPRHKSHEFKRHACLVSFYDLDKVFKYEADLLKEKTKKPVKVEDTECYKYDLLRISKPKEDGKERKDDDDVTRFILENKQKKLYVHRKSDPIPQVKEEPKKKGKKK